MKRRLAVAGLAIAVDLTVGELPNRWHPVAWLGRGVLAAEHRLPRETGAQQWRSGLVLAAVFAGGAGLLGLGAQRALRCLPGILGIAGEAVLLKQSFAIRALFEHARAVERPLEEDDLVGARAAAGYLVSRSTGDLTGKLVASAAIESLTENSSDSVVAPLLWYGALGLPGAFAYRAANTLDATVGYHSKGRFGTPSARLDDALNFIPARVTGALLAAASTRPWSAASGMVCDASATASPNSGWPMAAAAHGLGVRLEKQGRHVLNPTGRLPGPNDIGRARLLVARGLALGVVVIAVGAIWR